MTHFLKKDFFYTLLVGLSVSKVLASQEVSHCIPTCQNNHVCMHINTHDAACIPIPSEAPIDNLILPFNKDTLVACTHSSGTGTHSWSNAFWAIDLATPYTEPAAVIYAAAEGQAYISPTMCPQPPGNPSNAETSNCGNGWGNWVKIRHKNNYFTFYAHLERPLIQNNTYVHQGDPIGIEGWTGAAGHRHLHWSVQFLPQFTEGQWQTDIATYTGDAVPFSFRAMQDNQIKKIKMADLRCAHASDFIQDSRKQPKFKGIK